MFRLDARRFDLERTGQISADREQLVLNLGQEPIHRGVLQMRAYEAEERVQFIHFPIGFNARRVFPHAPTSDERGLPLIARSRVDLRDAHMTPPL